MSEEAPVTQDQKEISEVLVAQDKEEASPVKQVSEESTAEQGEGEVAKTKDEEDNKNTCCCIFVNFPLLGVWGLLWTFIWPIFALVVMILFIVSLDSMHNCFKPSFIDGGLSAIYNLLLALFAISIIVTAILFFYDMYLFRAFAKELPELYMKARAGTLTNLLPDAPSKSGLKDVELSNMGYMPTPDSESSKDSEAQSSDPKDREKAKNPDLPTSPVGTFGKMIAYCEWKFYRVKRIPGLSFYHVQGGFELVMSDILSLAIVVSVCVGVGFVNVPGLLVVIKSVTSLVVRHLVGDLFCTNGNIVKKALTCCGVPRKCVDCLKKSCQCLKKCKCDCLKKCKCDCLKKCKCDCLKKCKMECCKKDIDCRHFKLRCRNISYQNAKRQASDAKKKVTVSNAKQCLTSSPLCTAVSLALLVSTLVLAACCAVHTVGERAWTLGGGVSNLELHPSFPLISGLSHLRLNLTSIDGVAISTICDINQPVSMIPFQSSSSYELPACSAGSTSISLTKKLFRTGAKVYLEVDAMAAGCEATLFTSEIDPLSCVGTCQVTSGSVDFCGRFQGTVFDEFTLASFRVCSL